MRLATRTALLAGFLGLFVGAVTCAAIYQFLLAPQDIGSVLSLAIALGAATSIAAFAVTLPVVNWRLSHSKTPLGPWVGGLLGLLVLSVVTFIHAWLYPGASGVVASFLGQFVVALIVAGWLAVLIGSAVGYYVDRMVDPTAA